MIPHFDQILVYIKTTFPINYDSARSLQEIPFPIWHRIFKGKYFIATSISLSTTKVEFD